MSTKSGFLFLHISIQSLHLVWKGQPVGISVGLGISIRIVSNFLVLSIRGIGSSSELKSPHLLFFFDFSLSIAYDIACLTFASLTFGLLTRKKILFTIPSENVINCKCSSVRRITRQPVWQLKPAQFLPAAAARLIIWTGIRFFYRIILFVLVNPKRIVPHLFYWAFVRYSNVNFMDKKL